MLKIIKSLVIVTAIVAVAATATGAYFSQSITSTGNTFSTANMTMTMNGGQSGPTLGPALKAQNFYPGAFAQSAAVIENGSGAIAFNPEISLANAKWTTSMADYLWLEVWTDGKLWYKDWIKKFPGYTSGKLVLDTIQPGNNQIVAFRIIMVETAPNNLQGKWYSVNVAITAHQWNDPSYPVSTPVDISSGKYVANTWSYSVCGVRQPNYYPAVGANGSGPAYDTTKYSPYFSYSVQGASPWGWSAKGPLPQSYQGGTTEADYSCTVK